MKTKLFVAVLLLVLLLPGLALAAGKKNKGETPKSETVAEYQPDGRYAGIYKWERLYILSSRTKTWFASKAPKVWGTLPCQSARVALREKGHFLGNLSDDGRCLGDAEAPQWASGNYLNFMTTGKLKD